MSGEHPLIKDQFTLEYIQKYPAVFGENDEYLKYLESQLNTAVAFRGDHFEIKGSSDTSVAITKKMVLEMYQKARVKKNWLLNDVKKELKKMKELESLDPRLDRYLVVSKKETLFFKTQKQQEYIHQIKKNVINFAIGAAGTGKTYLAMAFAISELYKGNTKKIILTRPVVEAGENLGFLPGTLEEKIAPYLKPIIDAIETFITPMELEQLMEKRVIEVIPLAYMRGRSLNNALIILDEAQNTTYLQMKMFLTRLGENSKMIITGDTSQKDLPLQTTSGLTIACEILSTMKGVSLTEFQKEDSVRHPMIEKIISSFENYENKGSHL